MLIFDSHEHRFNSDSFLFIRLTRDECYNLWVSKKSVRDWRWLGLSSISIVSISRARVIAPIQSQECETLILVPSGRISTSL